jgi:integrative and conjugative element protein (TIGR02256 family)
VSRGYRNHSPTPLSRGLNEEVDRSPPLAIPEAGGVKLLYRWRFRRRSGDVLIPSPVLRAMMDLAGAALPNETGGTLIGHYAAGDSVAVVERALGVRQGERRGVTHFFRPPDDVDGQLTEIFHASAGHTHYLGEWHTHPYASSSPSRLDRRTLRELARSPAVATDTPLLLILGGQVAEAPTVRCLIMDATGGHEQGIYRGEHSEKPGAPHTCDRSASVVWAVRGARGEELSHVELQIL